jgi:hypothetical protein
MTHPVRPVLVEEEFRISVNISPLPARRLARRLRPPKVPGHTSVAGTGRSFSRTGSRNRGLHHQSELPIGKPATGYHLRDWEPAVRNGTIAGFKKLHISPARVRVGALRGRLAAEDLPALAHTTKIGIHCLFGHADVGLTIPGWSAHATEVTADVSEAGRADASHPVAEPLFVQRGEAVPGNEYTACRRKYGFGERIGLPRSVSRLEPLTAWGPSPRRRALTAMVDKFT